MPKIFLCFTSFQMNSWPSRHKIVIWVQPLFSGNCPDYLFIFFHISPSCYLHDWEGSSHNFPAWLTLIELLDNRETTDTLDRVKQKSSLSLWNRRNRRVSVWLRGEVINLAMFEGSYIPVGALGHLARKRNESNNIRAKRRRDQRSRRGFLWVSLIL